MGGSLHGSRFVLFFVFVLAGGSVGLSSTSTCHCHHLCVERWGIPMVTFNYSNCTYYDHDGVAAPRDLFEGALKHFQSTMTMDYATEKGDLHEDDDQVYTWCMGLGKACNDTGTVANVAHRGDKCRTSLGYT